MNRPGKLVALVAALAVMVAACGGDDDDDTATTREGPAISIGAQKFGESAILANIYKGALEADGFDASVQELGGFRDILFSSFESGDINLAPDYVASNLEFLNDAAGEATNDVDETLGKLQPRLEDKGLTALTPSDAVDTNAFVVTSETAEANDLSTLSDLAANGADLRLGAPQDCETNGFCIPGLKRVYGLDLSANFVPLEFELIPDSLEAGEIDVAVMGSTDGRIEANGWVLLEDDKSMLAADNVFPLASQDLVDAYGDDLSSTLDAVSAELTSDELTALNKRYDVDHEDADAIAADWLDEHGLS